MDILQWIVWFVISFAVYYGFLNPIFVRPWSIRKRFTAYILRDVSRDKAIEQTAIDHNVDDSKVRSILRRYGL